MSDEKPTITVETPSGKQIVIKQYLTARERNDLRSIVAKKMVFDPTTGEAKMGEIGGDILFEQESKLVSLTVVEYDGSKENILERLLDSSPEEYDFVVAESGKTNTGFLAPTK